MLRTVVIVSLALAAAAACGGKSASPATSPEPATTQPVVSDPAPPAGDFGTVAIARMTEFKEQVCACADSACVLEAEKALMEWATQHSDALSAFEPSKEQDEVADGIEQEIDACRTRVDGASAGSGGGASGPAPTGAEILAKMRSFKDKLCACKDLGCLEKVEQEMSDWAMQHMAGMKDVKPTKAENAEADKIQAEMDRCREKFAG